MVEEQKKADLTTSSTTYINEVVKIKNSLQDPATKLQLVTILIKDYFRKRYHASKNMGFSEMIDFFLEKRKANLATFCHDMVNDLYSGETIDEQKINIILENAKITITKDLSNREAASEKISVKEVINPFSAIQDAPIEKERILSKNARKLIERYLKDKETEGEDLKMAEKAKTGNEEESMDSLKKKLSLNQNLVTQETLYSKEDDPEKIESIDNFERIKDKIKKRKI